MKGTVKFYNEGKEFGFITGEDGKDVFVHKSALEEGVRLREGDKVTFNVEQGDRGPKALNVKVGGTEESDQDEEFSDEDTSEDSSSEDMSDDDD